MGKAKGMAVAEVDILHRAPHQLGLSIRVDRKLILLPSDTADRRRRETNRLFRLRFTC